MNKLTKRVLSVFLALAMIVTILPPVTAQAATKKSVVLYKGEGRYYTNYVTVKSVKSSNAKIVKAWKDKEADHRANVLAKKAGKATVSVKTKRGNFSVAVTVKNAKFDAKLLSKNNGSDILVSVKNNNKDTFDRVEITYTLKDTSGNVIAKNSQTVSYLLPGKVGYDNIYVGSGNMDNVDLSQSSVKVTGYLRNWIGDYTYKDVSSKVKCTPEVTEETENSVSYNIKETNNVNEDVTGSVYTMLYDANDNLIGVERASLYLQKKQVKTVNYGYISKRAYPEYDHMKLVVQAYYIKQNK